MVTAEVETTELDTEPFILIEDEVAQEEQLSLAAFGTTRAAHGQVPEGGKELYTQATEARPKPCNRAAVRA